MAGHIKTWASAMAGHKNTWPRHQSALPLPEDPGLECSKDLVSPQASLLKRLQWDYGVVRLDRTLLD